MAALPSLVAKERLPAATSLYDALEELGYTLGPALGAVAFAVSSSPEGLLYVNGASFAVSAAVLLVLRFGEPPTRDPASTAPGLLAETRAGVSLFTSPGPLRALLASSGAFVVCLGMVNVGELLLARALGASDSQFSLLVAAMAIGIVAGSLLGSRRGSPAALKRRYLTGLLMCGVALVLSGSVPSVWAAMPAFALIGVGNGLGLVNQRVLIQTVVPDGQLGKAFGMTKSLASWSLMAAFLGGGALVAAVGPRWMFVLAGAGALIAWSLASGALRHHWVDEPAAASVRAAPEAV
jgi:predicted MFS family arabinose efflux permease